MKKNVYNAFHSLYHRRLKVDEYYSLKEFYERTQFWEQGKIQQMQLQKLLKLLTFVYENNRFYHKSLIDFKIHPSDIKSFEDFQSVPFLTKDMIRNNLSEIKTDNISSKRFIPNSTSGSTGSNLYFYSDKAANIQKAVFQARMDKWLGLEPGFKKVSIWGSRFDNLKTKKLISTIKSSIKSSKILSGYDLTDKDLKEHFEFIKSYKPDLISGYPSTLELFADYLTTKNYNFSPKAIRTEGETLFDFQRQKIQNAFKTPVFNYYSSREVSGIAQECKNHKGLHILSENIVLEIIDSNGISIDEGEGEVVVTDLHNYAMPFIRYKIGDLAKISRRTCTCGINLPLLEKVEGRTFDIVTFPNGNKVTGTYWTLLFKSNPGIENFQVLQRIDNSILIKIEHNEKFTKDYYQNILNRIKNTGGSDTEVRIEFSNEISAHKNGKRRYIIKEK